MEGSLFTARIATQDTTMPDTDPMRCSECDWTGEDTDLDADTETYQCPVCGGNVEFVM